MSLYDKSKLELTSALSEMTGYMSGLAKYDDEIPNKSKIRFFEYLIKIWSELDPESDVTKRFVTEWEEEIKKHSTN